MHPQCCIHFKKFNLGNKIVYIFKKVLWKKIKQNNHYDSEIVFKL